MVRQVPLLAACALLTIGNARAQTFTGTYTLPNQTGVVTLTLKQDAQGKVTGTLSGNGSTFQIQGEADGEDLIALASTHSAAIRLLQSFSPRWGPTTSRAMTRCAS